MLTLENLLVLLLLGSIAAWLWHAHGLRERALAVAGQHCAKIGVQLLDDNVALRRLALLPDARGRRRLARVYGFEFTVTGERRHNGSIVMFGRHVGRIELDPHPFPTAQPSPPPSGRSAEVIQLDQWRREHQRHEQRRR